MVKTIALLLFAALTTVCPAAEYWIDYTQSNDSANGTSAGTAWKRAPGMTGFAGSYSHSAGDRFYFKGGVVWSNACFQWTIANSGTSGSPDYYGTTNNFYTGGSFTQPVLDFSGVTNITARIYTTESYFTLDNFELRGDTKSNGSTYVGSSTVFFNGGTACHFTRNYVHGWRYVDGVLGNDYMICLTGDAISNRVDGTESLIGGKGSGRALCWAHRFIGNVVTNVSNGILPTSGFSGTVIESNIISSIVQAIDPAEHGNAVYVYNSATIRGNTIRDVFSGYQTLYVESSTGASSTTNLIYNNLIFNPGSGCIVLESDLGTGTNSDTRIFNNTLVGGASSPAFRVVPRATHPRYVAITNNHFVCDSSAILFGGSDGSIDVVAIGNNLTNTVSAATSAGYTAGNYYAPTAPDSQTVDAGTSLSAYFTTDIAGATRGATWDIGAYEYGSGGGDVTAPTCVISSPASVSSGSSGSYSTSSSTITVSGTSDDATATITWSNSRGGAGTCSGSSSWSQAGIALQSGGNVLTFVATDPSLNATTTTLNVTYTAPASGGSTNNVGTLYIR